MRKKKFKFKLDMMLWGIVILVILFLTIVTIIEWDRIKCEMDGGSWNSFHQCCCPKLCSIEEYYKSPAIYLDEHPECHCCFID